MRTDDRRRIPVPASESLGTTAATAASAGRLRRRLYAARRRGARTDVHGMPGTQVETLQVPFLRLCIDDVGIVGIDAALEAVTAADVEPVAGADAGPIRRARRAFNRSVVLRAAAHVVERPRVVERDPIELRQRQVRELPPRLHVVVGLVQAAVVAEQHVTVIAWIPHDFVMIDVDTGKRQVAPRLAAVLAARDLRPRGVDRFGVLRVDEDLVVVPGVSAAKAIVAWSATAALRALPPFPACGRRRARGR